MSGDDKRQLQYISLELIDPPGEAVRAAMEPASLQELADSIREHGLLAPILLRPRGVRYEVIAGHRRSIACRMADLFVPPCLVFDVDDGTAEAMKLTENADREEVNPADEAGYLSQILEKACGGDFDRLVVVTKRSASYLNARLTLFTGHEPVFAALQRGEIILSVATELNRFKDPIAARMHLDQAIAGGATARAVREWRRTYELMERNNADAIKAGDVAATVTVSAAVTGPICEICRTDRDAGELRFHYVHTYCNKAILEKLLREYHGNGDVE